MRRIFVYLLTVVLLASLYLNILLLSREQHKINFFNFSNANSRETYFTMHNIKKAHDMSKGKGVKVGIMDFGFALEDNSDLYSGGKDFMNDLSSLNSMAHHGLWMATTLREIAPECEIYALNTLAENEDTKVTAMIEAINWAIESHLDILCYSGGPISQANRQRFDDAVNRAIKSNIVTAFIHYDYTNNLWPDGMTSNPDSGNYSRKPDLYIIPYDFNTLGVKQYKMYKELDEKAYDGDKMPYFSISSTSPVAAGFAAILKGINNKLTPMECKDILIKTSKTVIYKDPYSLKESQYSKVADIGNAVKYLIESYK